MFLNVKERSAMPTYFDPDGPPPPPLHVAFGEEATRRVYRIAEHHAAECRKLGCPVPPDPLHALLEAADLMIERLTILRGIFDQAMLKTDGREPGDAVN